MIDRVAPIFILFAAVVAGPQILAVLPNVDPLVVIIGIFVALGFLQHLGFASSDCDSGVAGGATQNQGKATASKAEGQSDDGTSDGQEHVCNTKLRDAERALAQNSYANAAALAAQVVDADPECARAWEVLVLAQKWEGNRSLAVTTARKAMDIYEVHSATLESLVQELGATYDPMTAALECEARAGEFLAKQQFDLAFDCYAQGLDTVGLDGGDLRLRLLRGRANCAQQLQDWKTCRSDATELLDHDPNDVAALLQRAVANEALESFAAALEDARRLLILDSRCSAANRLVHSCRKALQ
eukprot:CAMPEP_0170245282 /NCGR_PEP_ID=MMETSP0116_2-20130129/22425_1 /TAXON_ID=400756 /ORGANISM="Durinskia baltica, Strain CSIRO CS-38" /LENGTH=299 /DNA_ID=CAMNT_0010496153 /DNA_START=67 /DNA_END=966 /DNA_ORIENTATION=+